MFNVPYVARKLFIATEMRIECSLSLVAAAAFTV